jgi:hypothetical protein
MVHHLHTGFLDNAENYRRATEYWTRLCNEVLEEFCPQAKWEPFFGAHKLGAERQPEQGAIWSLQNEILKRAIVIEQFPASNDQIVLCHRLDNFGASYFSEPIKVLTISCELSTEAAELARKFITAWVDERVSEEDIARLIRTTFC